MKKRDDLLLEQAYHQVASSVTIPIQPKTYSVLKQAISSIRHFDSNKPATVEDVLGWVLNLKTDVILDLIKNPSN
jgi:hypothetical protein